MADNVDITPGAGKTIATDDIAGVQYQRVKVTYGTDGSATDASSSNPFPVTVPVAATSIAKAEDDAHASADVGIMALAVRKATPANLSGADGDYEPLQVSAGRLWTSTTVTGSVAVTTDLVASYTNTDGSADVGRHVVIGGTDGTNNQTIATDTNGALKLAAGANNIGDVDVLSVNPGTGATDLGKAEDAAHSSGDVGVMALTVRSDTPTAKGGTDGDYQPAVTDNEGLLWVRPAPKVSRFSVTPTISTTVYASGDVLGGLQTISNAVRKSGGSGTILSILVLDKTQAQRAAIDILVFDRSVTVAADNAPVAMSDADMANCLGVISIGAYNTAWPGTPLNSISTLVNVGLPIVCNGADLYFVPVVRATPTYVATTDLVFIFTILQD